MLSDLLMIDVLPREITGTFFHRSPEVTLSPSTFVFPRWTSIPSKRSLRLNIDHAQKTAVRAGATVVIVEENNNGSSVGNDHVIGAIEFSSGFELPSAHFDVTVDVDANGVVK